MHPQLYYLPIGPFSHRAKWALDHYGIRYETKEYQIAPFYWMQLPLRWQLGRLIGPITAPILVYGQPARTIMDSALIARWAEQTANGNPASLFPMNSTNITRWAKQTTNSRRYGNSAALFPQQHSQEFERWLAAADELVSLFRRELYAAGLREPGVRDALLPPRLVRHAGLFIGLLRWVMHKIFIHLSTKYAQVDAAADPTHVDQELRAASQLLLDPSRPRYLLQSSSGDSSLSYADIALATAINKCVEMAHTIVPSGVSQAARNGPSGGRVAPAAGEAQVDRATADLDVSRSRAVISYMPRTQQLLQQYPELVEWADGLVRQHWPAGVVTLHGKK